MSGSWARGSVSATTQAAAPGYSVEMCCPAKVHRMIPGRKAVSSNCAIQTEDT